MTLEVVEKTFNPQVEKQTVVESPTKDERGGPYHSAMLQIVTAVDEFTPWGQSVRTRDRQLRDFFSTEPLLASAVYSTSVRNASFMWEVVGRDADKPQPSRTIHAVENMLHQANRGRGWHDWMLRTSLDLYTQDNGAFTELIRTSNTPTAPVIGIGYLDAGQCIRTGDPKYPVIYYDRWGKEIVLPYWKVHMWTEFPSTIETMYGMQYCAVTRCLMAAQILRDINVYKREKVSGQFAKRIELVSGVTRQNIDDAIAIAKAQQLNQGLFRFVLPVIIPGIDPQSAISHVSIDIATLPDGYDEETTFKWYIAQLALAFGVDYQEFAPLMAGNLGTSQQAEILHLKTRGKGPALIMQMIEEAFNYQGILPSNVKFRFLEQDIRSEREKAEAYFTRVKARSMQLKSGELDVEAARSLAVEAGDMPEHMIEEINQRGEAVQIEEEMGAEQVLGGTESHESRKISRKDIERVRIKAGFGNPSGTVVLGIEPTVALLQLQNKFVQRVGNAPARWVPPEQFHITLVSSPLVDAVDFYSIFRSLPERGLDSVLHASKLGYFDVEGGHALVLFVDPFEKLKTLHQAIYNTFTALNVPVAATSAPDTWKPHVTLGYLTEPIALDTTTDINLSPTIVSFTRSDYRTIHEEGQRALEYVKSPTSG